MKRQVTRMQFDNYSIRLLGFNDLVTFYQLIDENRDRLKAFFAGTVAKTETFDATKTYLLEVEEKIKNKLYLPYVIVDHATDSFAGFLDIKNIDWNIPKGELGCFIDIKYAGQGLSKKAFGLFTDTCFTHLGFNKLFLRTHESNMAAKRLAESCGFELEGRIRRDYKTTEGELVDLLYYGKLPDTLR